MKKEHQYILFGLGALVIAYFILRPKKNAADTGIFDVSKNGDEQTAFWDAYNKKFTDGHVNQDGDTIITTYGTYRYQGAVNPTGVTGWVKVVDKPKPETKVVDTNIPIKDKSDYLGIGLGKYRIVGSANVFKNNPDQTDAFGEDSVLVVNTLYDGDIIDVTATGGGGHGIVMEEYLFLSDGTFIGRDNAVKV